MLALGIAIGIFIGAAWMFFLMRHTIREITKGRKHDNT